MTQSRTLVEVHSALLVVAVMAGMNANATPTTESPAAVAVSRAITALGGADALAKVGSLSASGTYEGVSGLVGSFQLLYATPDKRRFSWDLHYISQERGFDGSRGWERNASVRELAGPELARERDAAVMSPLYYAFQHHYAFELLASSKDSSDVLMRAVAPDGNSRDFVLDSNSYLVKSEKHTELFAEGREAIVTTYSDYRKVGQLWLPFSIEEKAIDLASKLTVAKYLVNAPVPRAEFENPNASHEHEPYQLSLTTVPSAIYKEADNPWQSGWMRAWGIAFFPTESWTVDFVVNERYGRYVEPRSAVVELYSGAEVVRREELPRAYLMKLLKFPVARFLPLPEIYDFRRNFSEAQPLQVDRIVCTFTGTDPNDHQIEGRLDVPVGYYQQKSKLIFPIKGRFVITTGHEFYELEHKYERSQAFGMDIVPVGEQFELASHDGRTSEDYVGFAKRDVLAPADGTVLFARNDVPDEEVRSSYLKRSDGLTAVAGNLVMIDHGNSEVSLFAHMHQGSVLVKTGDHVTQGQVIGKVGAAGSPKLPHLHYQLQANGKEFGGDGLPVRFENLESIAWLADGKKDTPKRGLFYIAR